jgi:predicted RNA-binding Zn ribbon-like protein
VRNAVAESASGRRQFELIGGHAVLDLVNTLDWRFRDIGSEELMTDYKDLVHFAEQSGIVDRSQARRLIGNTREDKAARVVAAARELREAAGLVLYAAVDGIEPPATSVGKLEGYFNEARKSQRLRWNGTQLRWELSEGASVAELPLRLLSLSAADLLTSDDMGRLRECGNPECRWLFLDTSKNHTRRWCDMKICGNRMKARRFKAQHASR